MITKQELIGYMSPELLITARSAAVRHDAFEDNPRAYSQSEGERVWMDYYRMVGDIIKELQVESHRNWRFGVGDGAVWYDVE